MIRLHVAIIGTYLAQFVACTVGAWCLWSSIDAALMNEPEAGTIIVFNTLAAFLNFVMFQVNIGMRMRARENLQELREETVKHEAEQ